MRLPHAQTLTGLCGLIPYAGGVICALLLDLALIIIDSVGPGLLNSIVNAMRKVALDLTLQIATHITDPLIGVFVKGWEPKRKQRTKPSPMLRKRPRGRFRRAAQVLIDLVVPLIEMLPSRSFSTTEPEIECRIRLRGCAPQCATAALMASDTAREGGHRRPFSSRPDF